MSNNPRPIAYEMSKTAFDAIVKTRPEVEKNTNPYTYVMNILNEQGGLKGTVKEVHVREH